jgi:hypothetical protein
MDCSQGKIDAVGQIICIGFFIIFFQFFARDIAFFLIIRIEDKFRKGCI